MSGAPIIALSTDFGAGSTYVAQLKGVLLAALPEARIVDVTHELSPFAPRQAELHLRGTAFAFPLGTVHVVIVDPGVGTARRGLAVEARGTFFVGPDNGLLGIALAQPDARCVALDRPAFFRHPVAPTFHGRDVFAPVAAELAAGLPLSEVGSAIQDALPSGLPEPRRVGAAVHGEVLGADRFGNLTTNLGVPGLQRDRGAFAVAVDGAPVPWHHTYGEAAPGELMALSGSDGYLELAVREASAAARVRLGAEVVCGSRET